MSNERIDIKTMESNIRLWGIGDISDEDLALEMDYMVPELKRCYDLIDCLEDEMDALIVEVKQLREENDALSEAIGKCVITQMNSAEHGARYQYGGCFEHYSDWKHEKDEEE